MIKIALADDHAMVREGLRALLEEEPDFEVVGEADDRETTIKLVKHKQPAVLVLDLMMKGSLDGIEIIYHLSNHSPETSIVILSMYDNERYIIESLRAGAKSYVLKGSRVEELKRAIREVFAGRRYLGLPISQRAITTFVQKSEAHASDLYDTLTNREHEVLYLVAQGYTNTEIAAELFVSPRTVEVHRANVMRKLQLQNHAQLVQYALQRKLLPTSG